MEHDTKILQTTKTTLNQSKFLSHEFTSANICALRRLLCNMAMTFSTVHTYARNTLNFTMFWTEAESTFYRLCLATTDRLYRFNLSHLIFSRVKQAERSFIRSLAYSLFTLYTSDGPFRWFLCFFFLSFLLFYCEFGSWWKYAQFFCCRCGWCWWRVLGICARTGTYAHKAFIMLPVHTHTHI